MYIFHKHDHKYTTITNTNYSLISVTQAIKTKSPKEDQALWDYWKLYKSLQRLLPDFNRRKGTAKTIPIHTLREWAQEIPTQILEDTINSFSNQWRMNKESAGAEGTEVHENDETQAILAEQVRSPFNGKLYPVRTPYTWKDDVKTLSLTSYADLEEGYYPELILGHGDFCGTCDRVFITKTKTTKQFDILDRKTSKKFTMRDPVRMLNPWGHLEDCSLVHGSLQVSFYGYFLLKAGLTSGLAAIHRNKKYVPVKFLFPEIKNFISSYYSAQETIPQDEGVL